MRGLKALGAAAVAVLLFGASSRLAKADSVSFTGTTSSPYSLSGSATFSYDGSSTLTVTLTNNGGNGDGSSGYIIGALFFTDSATLNTPTSAVGSDVHDYYTGTDSLNANIANDWAFKGGIGGSTLGLNSSNTYYALSGVGYGVFGQNDIIGNSSLSTAGGGTPPDGPAMMLAPTGFVPGSEFTNNGSEDPLVVGSAIFKFNVGSGFNVSSIGNVTFQYGTDLSDLQLTGTSNNPNTGGSPAPMPASVLTGSMLLLACGVYGGLRRFVLVAATPSK